jgi:hypothetical protein
MGKAEKGNEMIWRLIFLIPVALVVAAVVRVGWELHCHRHGGSALGEYCNGSRRQDGSAWLFVDYARLICSCLSSCRNRSTQ